MTAPPPEPPGDASGGDVPQQPPPPPGDPYATPATPPPQPPPPPGPAGGAPAEPGYGYGYGQPAYAGGAAAYGQQPPGLGDSLTYGWEKFKAHAGAILVGLVVYAVAALVVFGITYATLLAAARGGDGGVAAGLVFGGLTTFVALVVGFLVQAGIIRAALAITRGEAPTSAHFFTTDKLGAVVVASLLVGLASAVGYALCYLPGIVVSYLTLFTLFFVIDKDMGAVDAIKASVQLTTQHAGVLIVFAIVSYLIILVAAVLCVLPLLVAFPVVVIAQAYLYRRLQDEPVA
jgi:hypothetical protein